MEIEIDGLLFRAGFGDFVVNNALSMLLRMIIRRLATSDRLLSIAQISFPNLSLPSGKRDVRWSMRIWRDSSGEQSGRVGESVSSSTNFAQNGPSDEVPESLKSASGVVMLFRCHPLYSQLRPR